MSPLSDRLKSLGVRLGSDGIKTPLPSEHVPIEKVLDGRYFKTIFGECFTVEQFFPADYSHGNAHLHAMPPVQRLAEWARLAQALDPEADDFVFLDTETTGLSGGTGTFVFLVGIGRPVAGGFKLSQFFLRNPSEEPAMLAALEEALGDLNAVVSYNGKAFDLPMLRGRYTLNRMKFPLEQTPHFDLLPLARRLWRDRLPSRTLGEVERQILGAFRTQEEVPGYLVPQIYVDYLKSGDARPLAGVFYHNAMDVLSLAGLFTHTAALLADPLGFDQLPGLDLVALARLFEELEHYEDAVALYERGLGAEIPEEHFWKTVSRYALLYKRRGEWEKAIALWQKAVEHGDVGACIELAKYYEHRVRDYGRALEVTCIALEQIVVMEASEYQVKVLSEGTRHRMERLSRLVKI
ncbi:MAG: ribonuclease H-like domain-containing protein [Anaerolineaceae bacterium]|nr:ribonuclease H-like domain-containing protein [Anaerolineaceae bacterium]